LILTLRQVKIYLLETLNLSHQRPIGTKKAKQLVFLEKQPIRNKSHLVERDDKIAAGLERRARAMEEALHLQLFNLDLGKVDEACKSYVLLKRMLIRQNLEKELQDLNISAAIDVDKSKIAEEDGEGEEDVRSEGAE
jgi:hypothetical protein